MRKLGVVVCFLFATNLIGHTAPLQPANSPRQAVERHYQSLEREKPEIREGVLFRASPNYHAIRRYEILNETVSDDRAVVRVAEWICYSQSCCYRRVHGDRAAPQTREWTLTKASDGWELARNQTDPAAWWGSAGDTARHWLSKQWWLVISGSFKTRDAAERHSRQVQEKVFRMTDDETASAWVVRSDDFSALRPGYWVVTHQLGYCFSRAEAEKALALFKRAGVESYIRRVH